MLACNQYRTNLSNIKGLYKLCTRHQGYISASFGSMYWFTTISNVQDIFGTKNNLLQTAKWIFRPQTIHLTL